MCAHECPCGGACDRPDVPECPLCGDVLPAGSRDGERCAACAYCTQCDERLLHEEHGICTLCAREMAREARLSGRELGVL